MEKELKLQVTAGKASQIMHAPAVSRLMNGSAYSDDLVSTYFDTPDMHLRKSGASLRVRTVGEQRLQTLKLEGTITAGLFERDEFECPVNEDRPDLDALLALIPKDSKAIQILAEPELAERLDPLFLTRISRCAATLQLPDGTELELAMDDGAVEATAGPSAPIHGIELELKSGEPEQLYKLALAILHDVPLRIDHLSKADRGYGLLVQEPSAAVRAEPLKLKKRDSVEEAFRAIARNCLAQIHGNERGVVFGQDPSSVHQMRVGLRRLRSALDLFAPVIPAPTDFDSELRWIAGELGQARDWKVLAGATLKKAFGSAADDADATAVQHAAQAIATENRKAAVAAVNSVRYTRLIIQFTLWINLKGWRTNQSKEFLDTLDKPITGFASETLKRRHKKLLKRGDGLAELDDETRHRARIAAKKVRYATEFFASLFDRRAVKHYINALSDLQDDLGWRNDVVVASGLLRSLGETKPETAAGAGFARGYLASRAAEDHDAMKALWKKFSRLAVPHL
ncbi:CHAD domain-containing protein [Caballeronia sp. S22]|uniref:CYTH and CHAD domain-containing protein n=1 Tax=Caballeronia sp. S22 TaxID=3137182 RepID=UPI003530E5CD